MNIRAPLPLTRSQIALAVLMGITVPLALAPWIYYAYFTLLGWPVFSITHSGPLALTALGDQLFWANVALVLVLPATALVLAVRNWRRRLVFWTLALLLIQILIGLLNFVPLLWLVD